MILSNSPRVLVLALLLAWPVSGTAQDKTGRVKVQTPWLASSGYMHIDGIDGESRDVGHEKWIRVRSLVWGPGAAQPSRPGGGAGEVVLTRELDGSSAELVETIGRGALIPRVVLHAPAGADSSYQAFELENVRITSYSISTTGTVPTESITFHFEKIDIKDGPVLKGQKILQN